MESTVFKYSKGCRTADRVASFQTDHETRDISSVLTSKYILLNENDQKLHIINLTRGVCGQLTRSVDISETTGEDSGDLKIVNWLKCSFRHAAMF